MTVRFEGWRPTGSLDLSAVHTGERAAAHYVETSLVERGTLSALVTALAETNTLVLYAEWQVSEDNSTWVTCNASTTAFATGTAGADTAVTRVIPANDSVYGWRLARISLRAEVVNGTSSDTYSMSYNALKDQS